MANISLEEFYLKIQKHINLATDYSGYEHLSFIIKSCRLKPVTLLEKGLTPEFRSTKLFKEWIDEFNCQYEIIKDKRIKLHPFQLNNLKKINTDLYYGLNIKSISKISKLALFIDYQDPDLGLVTVITFYGIDNYFRTFMIHDDKIEKISTLLLGIRTLNLLAEKINIGYFEEISIRDVPMFPDLKSQKAYLTFWPGHNKFWDKYTNSKIKELL